MATEARDSAWVAPFLRDLGCSTAVVRTAERLLAGGASVFESGWRRREGVLVLGGAVPPDGERPALVAAGGERALRGLLLALPRGQRLRVGVGLEWHLGAVAEVMDGSPAPDRADCFAGVKRGRVDAGPALAGGDPLLDKRHAAVDLLRELSRPEGRERLGRFVAEGPTLVRRAIDDGLPVGGVVYRTGAGAAVEPLDRARAAGIPRWRASDGLMGTLTATRPLPDVLAPVHLRLRDAGELPASRPPTVLVAENLQNPDNLGMVLRTADAAGTGAVVVAGAATDPLHRNCVRAARGAVGRIPIFRCADLPAWIATLRESGFRVVGATAHGTDDLYGAELAPPIAVVVGNEESGISRATLAACSAAVAIPMAPGQDSLNVAVAAGVVLFELLRRDETAGPRPSPRPGGGIGDPRRLT